MRGARPSAPPAQAPAVEAAPGPVRPRRRRPLPATLVLGLCLLAAIAGAGLLAPWIAQHDPVLQNLRGILQPPSATHWLGTDHLGRDVFARLVHAARIDLAIGIGAIVAPLVAGTILGGLAGYYGGAIDTVVTALVDVVMAFPYYVLVIVLVFALGAGISSIFVAVGLVGWVSYARIARAEVLEERNRDYVLAARALGYSDVRILLRHILPNTAAQPITYAMSDIVVVIVGVVTLSYLGLGVPPPTPEWGSMIAGGQAFMLSHWHLSTLPGIAVIVTGLAFSLVGDGLNRWLRPQ